MGKLEYLDALKRAMTGLAPELQAKTLAYYEQRFVDAVAAGGSESALAQELDDPKKIAMTLRANIHMNAFAQKKNPANAIRWVASAAGLAIFNLFMVVPAMVYAAILTSLYTAAFLGYLGGVAITASGLAGSSDLVLDGPFHGVIVHDDDNERADGKRLLVSIGIHGINVTKEDAPANEVAAAPERTENGRSARALKRAGAVARGDIHIVTDVDEESRTLHTIFGVGVILVSIALFLFLLVVTKYTIIGLKRYAEMNFSLLKGS